MTIADQARNCAISLEAKKDAFEALVSPEPNTGCWLWMGAPHNHFGYGTFQFNFERDLAHRASWRIYHGPIAPGLCVCHRCDFTPCVNPDHLFLGSIAENTLDMVGKSRHRGAIGEKNAKAKLTRDDVLSIRASSATVKDICAEYGIGKSMAYYIRAGKYWTHL